MEKELVFGIDEKFLGGLFLNEQLPEGFPEEKKYLFHILRKGYFRDRRKAEVDASFKQIIPYVVIMNSDEEIFSYTRAGSEERLHDQISLGIGGHINPVDFDTETEDMLFNNIYRELYEEVDVINEDDECVLPEGLHLVGPELVIYAGGGLVNQVHLGLMFYCFLEEGHCVRMSSEGKEGRFRTFKDLVDSSDSLETWSKIVLPFLG